MNITRSYILENMVRKFLPGHHKCLDYEGGISMVISSLDFCLFVAMLLHKGWEFGSLLLSEFMIGFWKPY